MKKRTGALLALAAALLLLAAAVGGLWLGGRAAVRRSLVQKPPQPPESESAASAPASQDGLVHYQGKTYRYNENLITALCMGIDEDLGTGSAEWGHSGQADSIFLAVIDETSGRIRLISISRDTMTQVETYSAEGEYLGLAVDHLAVGYAYGDGAAASCEMMVRNVSRLFYDIPIHLYAAVSLDAIAPLNDAVGGVSLTVLSNDLAAYGPYYFRQGQAVTLKGKMARAYIQGRDTETDGSNNSRMARQKQYAAAYVQTAAQAVRQDPALLVKLYDTAMRYTVTNVDLGQAVYLGSKALAFSLTEEDICAVAGENRYGGRYDEFYADDTALYELILEVFYTEVEQ